jgi:Glycosyl hydrolases family 16
MDRIMSKDKYLGDSSKTDWVMDGTAVIFQNTALLTMAPNTVGTVLATSTYMWYGNVKARFRTSRGQGVVTAFILLSDVKDEIDYEFVGVDLGTAQSNYYSQGITNCAYMQEALQQFVVHHTNTAQMTMARISLSRIRTPITMNMKSSGRPIPLPGSSMVKWDVSSSEKILGTQRPICGPSPKLPPGFNYPSGPVVLLPTAKAQSPGLED